MALRSKEGRDHLVLVEGLIDTASLQSQGFPNVAGIGGGGAEFSPSRWEALAGFGVRSVTLALDNDAPGRKGTLAALEKARKAKKAPDIYVVDPTDYMDSKDPDELVRTEGLDASEPSSRGVGLRLSTRAWLFLMGLNLRAQILHAGRRWRTSWGWLIDCVAPKPTWTRRISSA